MKDLNIGGKYSFADFGYFSPGIYTYLITHRFTYHYFIMTFRTGHIF
jgi:hypothetical protein